MNMEKQSDQLVVLTFDEVLSSLGLLDEPSSDLPEVTSDLPEVTSDLPEVTSDLPEVTSDLPEVDGKRTRSVAGTIDEHEARPLNRRQRAFARALASDLAPVEAYAIAGFRPHRANCLRLARDPRIIAESDRVERCRVGPRQLQLALGRAVAMARRKLRRWPDKIGERIMP